MLPPIQRRIAALLASFALLAVPARGVVVCGMDAAATVDAVQPRAADADAMADAMAGHDHAAMTTDAAARDDAGDPQDTGERPHPTCDHLVGCAPLALATTSTLVTRTSVTSVRPVPFVADRVASPTRSLEPPPPKG